MTTLTRTQWFYPLENEIPEHSGVYERNMEGTVNEDLTYSYWDGNIHAWLNSALTVEEAANEVNMSDYPLYSSWQDLPWRGIVKDVPDEL